MEKFFLYVPYFIIKSKYKNFKFHFIKNKKKPTYWKIYLYILVKKKIILKEQLNNKNKLKQTKKLI